MKGTRPTDRAKFINGLRDLAAFIAAHPGFPVPTHESAIHVFPDGGTDADRQAGVDLLAPILDVTPNADEYSHYTATRHFGPIAYRVVAISDAARAVHRADTSYHGCIQPDIPETAEAAEAAEAA